MDFLLILIHKFLFDFKNPVYTYIHTSSSNIELCNILLLLSGYNCLSIATTIRTCCHSVERNPYFKRPSLTNALSIGHDHLLIHLSHAFDFTKQGSKIGSGTHGSGCLGSGRICGRRCCARSGRAGPGRHRDPSPKNHKSAHLHFPKKANALHRHAAETLKSEQEHIACTISTLRQACTAGVTIVAVQVNNWCWIGG